MYISLCSHPFWSIRQSERVLFSSPLWMYTNITLCQAKEWILRIGWRWTRSTVWSDWKAKQILSKCRVMWLSTTWDYSHICTGCVQEKIIWPSNPTQSWDTNWDGLLKLGGNFGIYLCILNCPVSVIKQKITVISQLLQWMLPYR